MDSVLSSLGQSEIIKAGQGKQFRFVDKVDAAESIYVRASKDSELGKAPWLIAMSCWHTDMYWQFINIL